jgi:hypothetical protein
MEKLNSFGISNYKAFGQGIQEMPLKSITLIFGPNSAGKSSLLHSLFWALSSSQSGDFESRVAKVTSGDVELGAFRSLLHKHDLSRRIEVSFSIKAKGDDSGGELPVKQITAICQIGLPGNDELLRIEKEFIAKNDKARIYTELMKISENARCKFKELYNYGNVPNHDQIEALINDESAFEQHIVAVAEEMQESGYVPFDGKLPTQAEMQHHFKEGEKAWREIIAMKDDLPEIQSYLQKVDEKIAVESANLGLISMEILYAQDSVFKARRKPGGNVLECDYVQEDIIREIPTCSADFASFMVAAVGGRKCKSPYEGYTLDMPNDERFSGVSEKTMAVIYAWVGNVREIIHNTSKSLIYLGPLRHLPGRKELLGMQGERSSDAAIIPWQRIRDESELRNKVNKSLLLMQTSKCEFVRNVHARASDVVDAKESGGPTFWWRKNFNETLWLDAEEGGFGNLSEEADFDSLLYEDEKAAYKLLDEKLLRSYPSGTFVDLGIRDRLHGVTVSVRDVGVGISQVAPVLLHAHANQEKLIVIEQPEIHIHPRLQAELGDVFIESALGENKNRFLLETHSEHLILRILRRIRETTEGDTDDWPDEFKNACPDGIRPEDVAVLYVEPGEDGAKVIELPVTLDGDFSKPWPGGFFAERIRELYSIKEDEE